MDNLTNENCWNELREQHPALMERFCAWIDDYKVSVDWESLFQAHPHSVNGRIRNLTPKYHELPLALQIGIMWQFMAAVEEDDDFNAGYIKRGFLEFFKRLERQASIGYPRTSLNQRTPPTPIDGAPI